MPGTGRGGVGHVSARSAHRSRLGSEPADIPAPRHAPPELAGLIAALSTGGSPPTQPPAPPPKVAGIPETPTAQQEARALATWLRRFSG